MNKLGISIDKKGSFGKFLKDMKKKGKCEMVFRPSKKFKKEFKLRRDIDKYKFDTHNELDGFVTMLLSNNCIAFKNEYKDDYKLLKSFDRAFWLRHFKKPDIDTFKPSKEECPFDDPRKTKSYIIY
jgi:hypothetical protein